MTKSTKLATALLKGKTFTANQIKSKFDLANPTAAIANLRVRNGLKIVTTQAKNGATVYAVAV